MTDRWTILCHYSFNSRIASITQVRAISGDSLTLPVPYFSFSCRAPLRILRLYTATLLECTAWIPTPQWGHACLWEYAHVYVEVSTITVIGTAVQCRYHTKHSVSHEMWCKEEGGMTSRHSQSRWKLFYSLSQERVRDHKPIGHSGWLLSTVLEFLNDKHAVFV